MLPIRGFDNVIICTNVIEYYLNDETRYSNIFITRS